MINIFQKNARGLFLKIIHYVIAVCFLSNLILPGPGYAQVLSGPAHLVPLSASFTPVILRGIKVYPDNPLKFDFIVDGGNTGLKGEALKPESEKLIKYFLASLTVPQDDLWVNLSPYEKDRIIPNALSQTDMGKDMLAQDYLLKQITASLIYPEGDTGKKFWEKIYKKAYEQFGTTNIPIDTFNKVWIMPEKAVVYEQADKAFVVESKLKVMLESDYLAQQKNTKAQDTLASQIVRDVVIPELENEVNNGKNFAQLRQIYNALILAYWFKAKLKTSILNKVYSDQSKVKGIDIAEKDIAQKIYGQYVDSFKQGVMNFIKVEHDQYTNKNIPRKYFAGGVIWDLTGKTEFQKGARAGSPILRSLQKAVSILALTVILTVGAKQANAQASVLDQPVSSITEKVEAPPDSILAQVQAVSPTVDSVYQLSDEDFLNKKNVDPFVIDSVLATKKFESSQLSNGLANKKTKGKTIRTFTRLLNDFYTHWNDSILKDPSASKQAYPKKETDTLTSFINLPLFNEINHSKIRLYYEIINQNLKAKGYLLGLAEIRSLNEKEVPFFSLWQITKTAQQDGQNIYYVKNDLLSNPEALWSSGAGVTPAGDLFVVTSVLDELARGIYSKHSSGAPLDDLDEIQFGSMYSYFPETFVLSVMEMFSKEFLLHEIQHVEDIDQESKGKDFSVSPFDNELWGLLTKGYSGLSSADTLDASSVRLVNLELRAFLRMFINGKLLFWDLKSIASFFNYKFSLDGAVLQKNMPKEQYQEVGRFLFPLFVRLLSAGDNAPLKPYVPGTKNQTVLTYLKKVQASFSDLKEKDIRDAALAITYLFAKDMLSAQEVIDAKSLFKENPKWLEVAKEGGIDPEAVKKIPQESPQEDKIPSSERAAKGSSSSNIVVFSNSDRKDFSIEKMAARMIHEGQGQAVIDDYQTSVENDNGLDQEIYRILLGGFASHLVQNSTMHGVDKKPNVTVTLHQDPLKQKPDIFEVAIKQDIVDDNSWRIITKNHAGWKENGEDYLMNLRARKSEGTSNNFGLGFYAVANMLRTFPVYLEYERSEEKDGKASMTTKVFIKVKPLSSVNNDISSNIINSVAGSSSAIGKAKISFKDISDAEAVEDQVFLEDGPRSFFYKGQIESGGKRLDISFGAWADVERFGHEFVRHGYLRVGPVIICTKQFLSLLTGQAIDFVREKGIVTEDYLQYGRLLVPIVASMLETDITDTAVWDYGSGEGILGLLSLRLGAGRVIGVEKDEKKNELAKEAFQKAGFKVTVLKAGEWEDYKPGDEEVIFIQDDLAKVLAKRSSDKNFNERLNGARKSVGVTNTGFSYREIHPMILNAVMAGLDEKSILGGYEWRPEGSLYSSNNAKKELEKRGEKEYKKYLIAEKTFYDQAVGNNYGALIVEKKPSFSILKQSSALVINNVPKSLKIPVGPIVTELEEATKHKAAIVTINGTRLRIVNDSDRRSLYNHNFDIFINEGVLLISFSDAKGEIRVSAFRSAKDSTLTISAERVSTNETDDVTRDFEEQARKILEPMVSSNITLPPHWNKDWPVPSETDIEMADKVLEKVLLGVDPLKGDQFANKDFSKFSGDVSYEKAKILQALYFKYPNIAASLFITFGFFSNHGKWKKMLNPSAGESDETLIRSDILAAMVNRAIEIYTTNNKEAGFENADYEISSYGDQKFLRQLGGLFGYFPQDRSLAIIARISDENFATLVKGMLYYIAVDIMAASEHLDHIKEVLRKIPAERLQKIMPQLSGEEQNDLADIIGKSGEKSGISSTILPSHWKESWPVPEKKYLNEVDKFFDEDRLNSASELGRSFAIHAFGRFLSPVEHVEFLKACYFKYPKLTGLFFPTSYGTHETWENILNLNYVESDEAFIPSDMIAAMLNQALEICNNKGRVQFEKKDVYFTPSKQEIQVLARFFRIFPKWRATAVLSSIKDENLGLLISGMLDFIYNSYTERASGQDNVRKVIREMPLDRLNKAAAQLNTQDRAALKLLIGKDFSSSAIVLPSHWKESWKMPQRWDLEGADEFALDLVDRSWNPQNGFNLMQTEYFGDHGVKFHTMLPALYFKYPNMASALFLGIRWAHHGALGGALNPSRDKSDESWFSSDFLGSVISRTFEIYRSQGKVTFEKKDFEIDLGSDKEERLRSLGNLLIQYLPEERLWAVARYIDEGSMDLFIKSIALYLSGIYKDEHRTFYADTIKELFAQIPVDRLPKAVSSLSEEEKNILEKLAGKKFSSDEKSGISSAILPAHWNEKWPVPTDEEQRIAQEVLKRDLLDKDFPGTAFVEKVKNDPYFAGEAAKFLRALYFAYPNIAATLFLSFHRGNHGRWQEILNPSSIASEEDRIESTLLASMFNRALEIYRLGKAPVFEHDGYRYLKADINALADLGGLLGYFPKKRSIAIMENISDENLSDLVMGFLQFAFSRGSQFEEAKDRAKDIIRSLSKDRLAKVNLKYSEDRNRLKEVVDSVPSASVSGLNEDATAALKKFINNLPSEARISNGRIRLEQRVRRFIEKEAPKDPVFKGVNAFQIFWGLYDLRPDLAVAILASFEDNHGLWRDILWGGGDYLIAKEDQPAQAKRTAKLINDVLTFQLNDATIEMDGTPHQVYLLFKATKADEDQEGFSEILAYSSTYSDDNISIVALAQALDADNAAYFLKVNDGIFAFTEEEGKSSALMDRLYKITRAIPNEKIAAIKDKLTPSALKFFKQIGKLEAEEDEGEVLSREAKLKAPAAIPAHWQKDWPVSEQKYLEGVDKLFINNRFMRKQPGGALGVLADVQESVNQVMLSHILPGATGSFTLNDVRELLKASYFKYPKMTSSFFVTVGGTHGAWKDILNSSDDKSDEDLIPSAMIASMMNQALDIYQSDIDREERDWSELEDIAPEVRDLYDLGPFFGYLPVARSLAITEKISDENLGMLISAVVNFIIGGNLIGRSNFDENRDHAKKFISQIPFDRLQKAAATLSDSIKNELEEIIGKEFNEAPEEKVGTGKEILGLDGKPLAQDALKELEDFIRFGVVQKDSDDSDGVQFGHNFFENMSPEVMVQTALGKLRKKGAFWALYQTHPDIAAAALSSFTIKHGEWRDILYPEMPNVEKEQEHAKRAAKLFNESLTLIRTNAPIVINGKSVNVDYNAGGIMGLLGYYTEYANDDAVLAAIIESINKDNTEFFLREAKRLITYKWQLEIKDDMIERIQKAIDAVSAKNATSGEAPGVTLNHWDKKWKAPQDDKDSVTRTVSILAKHWNGIGQIVHVASLGMFYRSPETFRDIYYYYPDIAAAIIMNIESGFHGEAADYFFWRPEYPESKKPIKPEMVGWMLNRVLDPEFQKLDLRVQSRYGEEAEIPMRYHPYVYIEILAYLTNHPEFIEKAFSKIEEKNLGKALSWVVDYLGRTGEFKEYANNYRAFLLKFSNKKIAAVKDALSPKALKFFEAEEYKGEVLRRKSKLTDNGKIKDKAVASAKGNIVLPDHWNKKWKIPTDEELKIADKILEEVIDRRSSDRFADWSLTIRDKISCKPADVLRALYFKYPNITASFFITSSHHGYWAFVLNPRNKKELKGLIESDLVASMMNRAFEMREKYKKGEEIVFEKTDTYLSRANFSQEGILGLVFSYLPESQAFKIISYIKEENFPVIIAMLQKYYDEFAGVLYQDTKYRAEDLIKKMTAMLEEKKSANLPAHWNKDWPVPTPESRAQAYGLLKELLDDPNFSNDGFNFKDSKARGKFAKILQALYFQYPLIAASLFLSIKEAHHGSWREAINPSIVGPDAKSDEDLIPSSMIAAMIDKATEIYQKDGNVEFENKDFHITPSFKGLMNLSSLFRYLGEERNKAVVRHLDEKTIKFFASPKGMPKGFLIGVAESIGRIKTGGTDANLSVQPPVGWNSEWGVPETTRDEIVQDLLEEGRLSLSRLPPKITIRAFTNKEAEYFRAIYYYFPDAAARIVGNIESSQHGAMAEYLRHYEVTGEMFGRMWNMVLDPELGKQDLMIRVSPQEERKSELGAGWSEAFLEILGYAGVDEKIVDEVFAQLQEDRLARALSLVVDYLDKEKARQDRVEKYQKLLDRFSDDRIVAVKDALSPKALKFFTDNGKVKKAPAEIPSHWNKDWIVPREYIKKEAIAALTNLMRGEYGGRSPLYDSIRKIDQAQYRALYYYYPDVATVILLSDDSNHGIIAQYLSQFIKPEMIGWMLNRAFDSEFQDLELSIPGSDGKDIEIEGRRQAVHRIVEVLRYFVHNTNFMNKLFSMVQKDHLGKALSLMVEDLYSNEITGEQVKDTRAFLLQFPSERIEEARADLSEEALDFFISYRKIVKEVPVKESVGSHWDASWENPREDRDRNAVIALVEKCADRNMQFIGDISFLEFAAIYYYFPDIATSLLMSDNAHHGKRADYFRYPAEAPYMVGWMFNRGIDTKTKELDLDFQDRDGKDISVPGVRRAPGKIAEVLTYRAHDTDFMNKVFSKIKKKNLAEALSLMYKEIGKEILGGPESLKDDVKKFLLQFPSDKIEEVRDDLSKEALNFFISYGRIAKDAPALPALPAHWKNEWRMPTEKEFNNADKFLQHLIATPRSLETGGFSPSFLREKVDNFSEALRALYFKYPNIAASLFINITRGSHGVWGDMLTYRSKNTDEDSEKMIESSLLADMISRALDIYRKDLKVDFEDKEYQAFTQSQSLEYLGILFAYLQPARRMAIVKYFDDRNLDLLLSALQKGRTNAKHYEYLTPLVAEVQKRIAQTSKALPTDNEAPSVEPKKEIPQYVAKKIPQITGTAIGKLVVFKENPYGEKDYLAIPKGSIAAFPFLAGSWISLRGHFNGIITYYPFIRGAHAKGRAQEDGIPGALWSGPDAELMKYNGQYVKFTVTRQGVTITPSSEEAFKEFEASKVGRETKEPEIPMPKYSSLKNGPLFLAPGSAQMKNPEEVGYKPALLNMIAGYDLSVSDGDIKIEADGGAALPFRTFFKFADSRSDLAPDSMKKYFDLANTLSREYVAESKEIEAKVKAMFDSMDKAEADKFLDAIVSSMKEQGQDPDEWMNNVFVRCATNIENVPDKPTLGSGIFKTVANVKGREAFLKAVFEVYMSMYSDKAYWEKEDNAISHSDVYPGVWLLRSKSADYSFVLRWQKGEDEVDVSLAQGLGEAVMTGEGELAGLPTEIVIHKETGAMMGEAQPGDKKNMMILDNGPQGGTKIVPVDPKKEFLNHPERDRILKALAELRTKVEVAADKEGILKNGFEIEAGIKFGSDGKTATITLLQVIDVNKKVSSAISASSSSALPAHWDKSWGPAPTQKYIDAADQFFDRQLSKDSFSFSFDGISSLGGNFVLDAMDYMLSEFKSPQERLDYLKACYFKYPKLTGLLFLTSSSFHADWGRFLNPEFANNIENEKLIPSDMIAAMMNQALEIYMSRGETQFEKSDIQFGGGTYALQVVARFFRVFPTERQAAVLLHIKDENLSTLLSGIIDFYFNSYDMVRGQIAREIVSQIAPERLEKAAVDLTRQERIGLMEITGDRSFGVSSPAVSSKQTVLIVDNTRRWREFLVKALGNNYEIIEAQNGDQALAEVEKGNIDLVVTDVEMPSRGDELAEELYKKFPNIPVIFHSEGYIAPKYEKLPNVKGRIFKNDALPSVVLEEVEKVLPKKVSSSIFSFRLRNLELQVPKTSVDKSFYPVFKAVQRTIKRRDSEAKAIRALGKDGIERPVSYFKNNPQELEMIEFILDEYGNGEHWDIPVIISREGKYWQVKTARPNTKIIRTDELLSVVRDREVDDYHLATHLGGHGGPLSADYDTDTLLNMNKTFFAFFDDLASREPDQNKVKNYKDVVASFGNNWIRFHQKSPFAGYLSAYYYNLFSKDEVSKWVKEEKDNYSKWILLSDNVDVLKASVGKYTRSFIKELLGQCDAVMALIDENKFDKERAGYNEEYRKMWEDIYSIAKRWKEYYVIMNLFLSEDLKNDLSPYVTKTDLNQWLKEQAEKKTWDSKGEKFNVSSHDAGKKILGSWPVEWLHLAIERLISNGYHAIEADKDNLPDELEHVDFSWGQDEKLAQEGKIKLILENPGQIPDDRLDLEEGTDLPEVFFLDPYRPRRRWQGQGFGLPFAVSTIHKLGGTISVENITKTIDGKEIPYTHFEIILPTEVAKVSSTIMKAPGGIASSSSSRFARDESLGNDSKGIETPGGIDFKAADSIIKTKGESVEFALPPELQGIDLNSFQGFTPVIIHIAPVTDFMGLLGLSTEDLKDEDTVLSQNAPVTDNVVALKD